MKKVINVIFFIAIILSGMVKLFGFLKDKGFSNIVVGIIIAGILFVLGLVMFNFSSSKPFYDEVDAVNVTFDNLPDEYKKKLSKDDIRKILDLKFKYQQKIGMITENNKEKDSIDMSLKESLNSLDGSVNPMSDALNEFVIEKSQKKYTKSELDIIWDAEEVYLKQIGAISSE